MATLNSINNHTYTLTSDTAITATTGNITATLGNVVITDGQLSLQGAVGTDGQIPVSNTADGKAVWASITAGSGIAITPGAGTVSIASTAPMTWSVMAADAGLLVNEARINTKPAALLTATLPATAAVGTVIILQGSAVGASGWLIAQNAGQNIQLGSTSTTIGAGGSLASTDDNDGVSLVCTVADTTWNAFSVIGNITVV